MFQFYQRRACPLCPGSRVRKFAKLGLDYAGHPARRVAANLLRALVEGLRRVRAGLSRSGQRANIVFSEPPHGLNERAAVLSVCACRQLTASSNRPFSGNLARTPRWSRRTRLQESRCGREAAAPGADLTLLLLVLSLHGARVTTAAAASIFG